MTDPRIVTKDCERPRRMDGTCFYCSQPVGGMHADECVAFKKTVTIRATIEYEIEVPNSWGKTEIEFQRNEGSWCASNMIDELQEIAEDGCLCAFVNFELVEPKPQ